MTDIENVLIMISNSGEEFSKVKSNDGGWKILFPTRDIVIYFNNDGKFEFISTFI